MVDGKAALKVILDQLGLGINSTPLVQIWK
jgi:hypothetical protein